MKRDIFNVIHYMIEDYEKHTDEKPYIILVSPKTYMELREYLKDIKISSIKMDIEKINYIFGIPVEISRYIIQEAICINERDYHKYCEMKYYYDNFVEGDE